MPPVSSMPDMMMVSWYFCVKLTALVPPETVYTITSRPIIRVVALIFQPSMVERMSEGA